MTTFEACSIIEGFSGEDHSEEDVLAAWQYLIDTGDAWQLQGFYGRTAQHLIQSGLCTAPKERRKTCVSTLAG